MYLLHTVIMIFIRWWIDIIGRVFVHLTYLHKLLYLIAKTGFVHKLPPPLLH